MSTMMMMMMIMRIKKKIYQAIKIKKNKEKVVKGI